jgi:hypothetical protein
LNNKTFLTIYNANKQHSILWLDYVTTSLGHEDWKPTGVERVFDFANNCQLWLSNEFSIREPLLVGI